MKLSDKPVLVTGGAGFIGSHLVERLVAEGCSVRVLVHYNSMSQWGHLDRLPDDVRGQLEIVPADVADPFAVRSAVEGRAVVFHLAALITIPYSYLAPCSYVATNVHGTLNVLEACRSVGVEKIVHTSTSETYGTAQYTPIDEEHPLQGQSPYSASKIAADKMAESYYRSFDLPVATLRPFNTFGPRQSARAVIPTVISQALAGREVRLGSLTPVRDLTYVDDTVAAFLAIAECDAAVGRVVNSGNGKGITIGDLAQRILQVMGRGKDCELVADAERVRPEKSEVFELICDNSLALELAGWQPSVGLEEGLAQTVDYVAAHRTAFKSGIYNV